MKKSVVKALIGAGVVAVSMLALTGCATKSAANKGNTAGTTIKIGVNMELSGAVAGYGDQEKQGVELAVKQINAAGGVKVGNSKKKLTAVYRDNKSSTSGAASVAAQLANNEKVVAIVGPATTNNGTASIPNITKAAVPMVGPSATDPNFTLQKNGQVQPYVFRACFTDTFQGQKAAVFADDTLKAKNVAIIADNSTDYGTGLAKAFKKKFTGKVVTTDYYQSGDKDFNAMLTNIKNTRILESS
ncbi:branched-chain amino acid ABC transporter substrate binding component [Lacticaseibacillus casei DSM 20011 = JCM 1134 = ATCC 393]|uniref:Branched-chain amino acid ABC transporter substrate binding component n=1 Tax=Lacticaseibacillus casei DSM 20011 = JCM 1134 = ATCC 393 TaxID=1423732 RepID=A0AAD1ES01_LACCA|nr:branched-chain amino acid ABC transporter substrate binding component [Lacticaseibacillus casei DSM 20011 = JCM 1134 = ATCC 393]